MKKTILLPKKQSALIRLAVRDAKVIKQNKKYILNMSHWHQPTNNGICEVCLAGSVIANTFKVSEKECLDPWDMDQFSSNWNCNRLRDINKIRMGSLNYPNNANKNVREVIWKAEKLIRNAYRPHVGEIGKRVPWTTYLRVATMLKKVGL